MCVLPVARNHPQDVVLPRTRDRSWRAEPRRPVARVHDLLRGALLPLQPRLVRERGGVVPVQPHHTLRGEHLPVVIARHVAERREPPPRGAVPVGRRAEVELRVGRELASVGRDDMLEVADAHVVRDDREVVAAEIASRRRQVADGRAQRLHRRETLVDMTAADGKLVRADEVSAQRCAIDRPREAAADVRVHVHPEELPAGRRDDLRQPGCARDVASGQHLGAPRTLDEDERLEHVRAESAPPGGADDQRPQLRDARGRADDSSGARCEEAAVETACGGFRERRVHAGFSSPRSCSSCHCRLGPHRAEGDDPRDDEREPGSGDERLENAKLPARTRQAGDQLGHRNPFLEGLRG
jgi:hypothetical protein